MSSLTSPPAIGLVSDPGNALAWWRIVAPFTRLQQYQIPARWARLDDTQLRLAPDDVVVMPRAFPISPTDGRAAMLTYVLEPIRQHTAAIVYDLDDDLFTEAYVQHHLATDWQDGRSADDIRRQCSEVIWAMNQMDAVQVASEPLANVVRTYTSAPVYVIPNAIDTRWFNSQLAVRSPWADRPTIGWAGGRRPPADLLAMAEAWSRVARRRPDALFVVAGDDSYLLSDAVPTGQLHRIGWVKRVPHYPMTMQVDIGCCAVANDDFSRMKTPIKAWEFALAGAAVVATPTLYDQDVADGFTGRLAVTANDWEDALIDLLEHQDQRKAYQQALAARVERLHSLDTQLWRWPAAWRAIVASKQGSRSGSTPDAPSTRRIDGALSVICDCGVTFLLPPAGGEHICFCSVVYRYDGKHLTSSRG